MVYLGSGWGTLAVGFEFPVLGREDDFAGCRLQVEGCRFLKTKNEKRKTKTASLHGLTAREIRAKLDEIVDFSGVEKFLDTPRETLFQRDAGAIGKNLLFSPVIS